MRKDFCAFILTHGRPNKVHTVRTLKRHGYTGKLFIVIDDEDETGDEYRRIYGDQVLTFSKDEVARYTDQMDTSTDRRSALWAYNACWDLAKQVGCRFFVRLDDDYTLWRYRRTGKGHRLSTSAEEEFHGWTMRNGLDDVFEAFVRLVETTPIMTIALSQGGDHRWYQRHRFRRKAMNSFVCDTAKPFLFRGRLNGDVNTYVALGNLGHLFFTDMQLQLDQLGTQSSTGGMTETYLASGTYAKSFYTVMAAPSCTTIRPFGRMHERPHHRVNWNKAIPRIIRQEFKKAA
jgi:hypothetical protein